MFKKILFPVDFSEGFYKTAEQFAKRNDLEVGEVILLHVIDNERLEELISGYSLEYNEENKEVRVIKEKMKKEAEKKMKSLVSTIKDSFHAKKVRSKIVFGTPWKEIISFAERESVSLILMASHGKMSFSHEVFGSTTMRVVKKTTAPVLLIKSVSTNNKRGDGE